METSEVWEFDVQASGQILVLFEKEVSREDAERLFNNGVYEEIIQEDYAVTFISDVNAVYD